MALPELHRTDCDELAGVDGGPSCDVLSHVDFKMILELLADPNGLAW